MCDVASALLETIVAVMDTLLQPLHIALDHLAFSLGLQEVNMAIWEIFQNGW